MENMMKNLFFLILSLVCVSLEATHFQSSMSVTPISDKNEFLIDMQIEKISDGCSSPELIASPRIICIPGEPAQLTIGSEDQSDFLSIQIIIPENTSQIGVQASVLMKEKDQVVLSFNNTIKLSKAN
jgi:hypothetical protein